MQNDSFLFTENNFNVVLNNLIFFAHLFVDLFLLTCL